MAWIAVIGLCCFLSVFMLVMGADLIVNEDTGLSDNGQLVIVSALGTIGTITGGALGYWAGTSHGTTQTRIEEMRREQDLDDESE